MVSTITIKYEADIDLPSAAAEVGLTAEAFRDRINTSETLTKHVGALRTPGGTGVLAPKMPCRPYPAESSKFSLYGVSIVLPYEARSTVPLPGTA